MSSKSRRFTIPALSARPAAKRFLLIGIVFVVLVAGIAFIRQRGAAPQPTATPAIEAPGAAAQATAARPSEPATTTGNAMTAPKATAPKHLAAPRTQPKLSKSQMAKLAKLLPEFKHAHGRVTAQAGKPSATPAADARNVARSKAALIAAQPRSQFSVGNEPQADKPEASATVESSAALQAEKATAPNAQHQPASVDADKPASKGAAVASAEARDADADAEEEEARERKERAAKRMLIASKAATGASGVAQESKYIGPSREELAAKGLDGISTDIQGVKPSEYNGDLRDLPQVSAQLRPELAPEMEMPLNPAKVAAGANASTVQEPNIPLAPMPSPAQNFQGLSFNSAVTGGLAGAGWPPDVNGDVGSSHYILSVNDAYAIYSKTGTLLASFTENSLWSGQGVGTPCNVNNAGDPVVIYDQFADRWILSHFAFAFDASFNPIKPFYQCFAISKTSNPVAGGWWFYAVKIDTNAAGQPPDNTLGDYPKFGNWNDGCLYMAANAFTGGATTTFLGTIFASFNKADMESGAVLRGALGFINNTTDPFTMIPSNISGAKGAANVPPAGTPNYFVSESQTAFNFEVRKFTPGANCTGGSLGAATNVSQTSYGLSLGNVVPQPPPATATHNLDSLDDRLMQKVQYRRVGSAESLWVTHSTRTAGQTARPQWAELDVSGGTVAAAPKQQQIYAPETTLYRWMASIAADHNGNVAMAYSTSNATSPNFPSIAYSGRLVGDPVNTLPQTEVQLIAGTGSQTTTAGGTAIHRWGDYTSMSIDPTDDCTFWYAGMYFTNVGADATRNWNTRVGSFKFPTCNAPTSVKVKTFTADGFNDGQVLLQWNTSYEVDNLGYNVYREVNGQRTRINAQMIAGSALMVGQNVAFTSGRAYAWSDVPAAKGATVRYFLEDVDLKGKSALTGPIVITSHVGGAPTADQSQLLAQLGQSQGQLLNGQGSVMVTGRAQVPSITPATSQTQAGLANGTSFKVGVKSEGWYRIAQPALIAAGLGGSINPRQLQLFVDGQEVPIVVNGEADGKFDLNDSVEFYGLGLDSLVTSEHVYWLAVGAANGQRIKSVTSAGGTAAPASFQTTVERKDRTIYFSSLNNGEKENFFGPVVSNTGVTQTLNVSNLAAASGGAASLSVAVQGVTFAAHQVQVLLNGNAVGTINFTGQTLGTQSFGVSPALLAEGSNNVRLVSLGGNSDVSLIDNIRITYAHKYAADGNQLRLTTQGGQRLTLNGFTSPTVRVMDVTNPNSPQELLGTLSGGKGNTALTLTVPGAGSRTLYAFAEQTKLTTPRKNTPSNWRKAGLSADYVVITRGDLAASLASLVNYRRGQGYNVVVVDVEDVFDEFSYGNRSTQAVRDFLAFTKANWGTAPRFVLLAGDGTYDYKNYLGLGDNDVVPSKLVDTTFMETASDDYYVDFNDDGLPDMAIGRLPVRNATEAARMAAKIIAYDGQSVANSVLLISDSNDGYDFSGGNNSLRPLIPGGVSVSEITRGSADDATVHAQVVAALNSGQKVVNYSGHGSINLWRGNLLTNDDAKSLTNGQNFELFVVMNCLNAYFIDPSLDSLGERLLRAESGGACAVWASSGQCEPAEQTALNQEFYRQLFGGSGLTVGEAAARAKAAVSNPDIRRTWTLLGDPAMRLK
jgi:Peptidase family C25